MIKARHGELKRLQDSEGILVSVVEPSGRLYGSELALLDILEGLSPRSVTTEVILPSESPFSAKLAEGRIPYLEMFPARLHGRSRMKKALSYMRLMGHWKRQKPDLIYVNQGGILRPIALIAKWLGIPILCQVQTLEDAEWVGSLRCHDQVSTFVCNSRFVAERCRVPAERLSTIYYGYKPKQLGAKRPSAPLSQDTLEVGLLGRICEGKGHYLVIEAARLLKASNSIRFHFRFIGDSASPSERHRIESTIRNYALTDWIELRGYQENIASEFAQMDVLAIPSVAEPFGRIFCEAAEAKVPVLLADSGGLGEISRKFDAGVRFAPGDVEQFVKCLKRVSEHYETVRTEFALAGERMLGSLDLQSYLAVTSSLIARAAIGMPVSIEWLGKEME